MGHGIGHDVNAHGVSFFLREFPEIPFVFPLSLPAVANIVVVAQQCHQTSIVVEEPPKVRFRIALGATTPGFERVSAAPGLNISDLWLFFEIIDVMKDLMLQ